MGHFLIIDFGQLLLQYLLIHSLLYRVDQVFLIHRETGLLLENVFAEAEALQDADLVSSMLTALQDFVRDSFNVERHHAIETVEVGEFTLWVEQGPKAILAAAIRGNVPEELRTDLHRALENIHLDQGKSEKIFDDHVIKGNPVGEYALAVGSETTY